MLNKKEHAENEEARYFKLYGRWKDVIETYDEVKRTECVEIWRTWLLKQVVHEDNRPIEDNQYLEGW
jgi:hypothetical protein